MKVTLSQELEWFRPFLKRVKDIVPIHKLEKIVSVKPRVEQIQHCHAQLVTETYTKSKRVSRYYISMNLYFIRPKKLKPLERYKVPFSKIDLLETLAHELAHLIEEDHTPKHKKLENRLCSIFMTMLANQGYVSEEHEMKHQKPKF